MSGPASGAAEREREKVWMAIVLAWMAAFVDAIGFLTLFGLFTAHLSGDTTHVGIALGGGRWDSLLFYLVPIPLFVVGAGLGSALRELATRLDARSPRALLLAAVWSAYMLGATAAVVAEGRWRFAALALPIGVLAVLVVVELAWPMSEPPHASGQRPHEQAQFPS